MATAIAPARPDVIAIAERRVIRHAFKPRERMSVLEWADSRRWLSPEANAMAADAGGPIRYDSSVTPYMREIMLALSDPRTEIVVMKFPSQDAKTETANNFIGRNIDVNPGPMLVLQPTGLLGDAWSKDRLAPMLRDTPALRNKVRDARSRDSDNTILHKKFPGGHLTIAGSNSPASLSARPIRDVVVDEADRCAKSAGTEGDSIRLAFRRTTTFRRGKKLIISSPTLLGDSRIDSEYKLGTQEELEVPCPHCGEYQVVRRGGRDTPYGIKWDHDESGAALIDAPYYLCEANGCVIEERSKAWMIDRYRWVARNPSAGPRVRSFTKNAWASNLASWRKLVKEWHDIQGKPLEIQQFVNTVDCELWDATGGEHVNAEQLSERLDQYPLDEDGVTELVPKRVAVLVRLVDTQDDRLETAVYGFGPGEECWRCDFEVIPGATSIPLGGVNSPWNELKKRLRVAYRHETGARLVPQVTFVDAGGHASAQVHAFTKAHLHLNTFAIKGANTEGAPLLSKPKRHDKWGSIYFMVGSFAAKETAMRRFANITAPGPGYIHLPDSCDGQQLAQFTNEKLITKFVRGIKKREWIGVGPREQFHLLAYAYCALEKLGPAVKRQLAAMVAKMAADQERREAEKRHPAVTPKPLPGARPPETKTFAKRWKKW